LVAEAEKEVEDVPKAKRGQEVYLLLQRDGKMPKETSKRTRELEW
jgi:hypothetical protein